MITWLLIAVGLRIISIYLVYLLAKTYYNNFIESVVVAWLSVFGIQNCLMLFLSIFEKLNKMGIIVSIIIIITIFVIICLKKIQIIKEINIVWKLNVKSVVIISLIVILVVGLLVRPFFYYDTTEDALVQGMTKLAFYQQHNSLFVRYDTLTINTFSNEWLGELNGLYYLLLTGADKAVAYGNIEIFLFLILCYSYCIEAYGYKGKYIQEYWILLCSLPVITAISMTIKTDLIAMAVLPLSVAFLIKYYKEETPQLLFASIISLGATAGAKIAVLPAAGLLLITLIFYYFKRAKKRHIYPVLLGGMGFIVFCSRYIINLIQYRNPFQRALNEKATFSFEHIKNSFVGILKEFNEAPELLRTIPKYSSWNWFVNKGTGYAGYILIAIILIAVGIVLKNCNYNKKKLYYIDIPIILAFLFFVSSTEWQVWSFRYVVPYIVILLISCISHLEIMENNYIRVFKFVSLFMIGISMINMISIFRWGQGFPYTVKESYNMISTEKKMKCLTFPKPEDLVSIPKLLEILSNGGSALVFDTFSYPYYQFFGDDNCVYVDLAYDEEDLVRHAEDKKYDFYVIATSLQDTENYSLAKNYFYERGFQVYQTTSGLIFMRE